jgi:hypothetical protein
MMQHFVLVVMVVETKTMGDAEDSEAKTISPIKQQYSINPTMDLLVIACCVFYLGH